MTSKTQTQKAQQGYVSSPKPAKCSACEHYTSEVVTLSDTWGSWTKKKNKRCGIGGFAVKMTAMCNLYVLKGER